MGFGWSLKDGDWPKLRQILQKIASIELGPESVPTFGGLNLTGSLTISSGTLTVTDLGDEAFNQLTYVDPNGVFYSENNLTNWIADAGTGNIVVADDTTGGVTLDTVQDILTTSSPTFANLTLTNNLNAPVLQDGFQHPNGFENRTESVISYSSATRLITVEPTGTEFYYWLNGTRYKVESGNIAPAAHANTTGNYFLYFNSSNTLTLSTTVWDLITDVPIALIYYTTDTTGSGGGVGGFYFDERHGSNRSPQWHFSQHFLVGTYWTSSDGIAIGDYTVAPAIPADADNQYSLTTGTVHDEDIDFATTAKVSGQYTVFYRIGASGAWCWQENNVPILSGGGYAYYNQFTGGAWQLTAISGTNKYLNMFVVETSVLGGGTRSFLVMGQTEHSSLASAQAVTLGDLSKGTFPFQEILGCYRITFATGAAYGTEGQVRIAAEPTDTRFSTARSIISGSAGTNHNALSGLQGGTASEYYHLTSADYTELTAWLASVTLSAGGDVNLGTGDLTAVDCTLSNDLLLASGSIINWDTGDITLTHSANTLTFAGMSTLDFGASALTTTGSTTTDTLSITDPTGGTYKFLDAGSFLGIQNQTAGQARFQLFTAEGDLGDNIGFQFYSEGLPGATTNSSQCQCLYITGSPGYWRIGTANAGTGTAHDLKIFATITNLDQIVLSTNGSVGINRASPSSSYKLDVNGNILCTILAASGVSAAGFTASGSNGLSTTFATGDGRTATFIGGILTGLA